MSKQNSHLDIDKENIHFLSTVQSPRDSMYYTLPSYAQPFLTWLTAKPGPGEQIKERSPMFYVETSLFQTLGGFLLTAVGMALSARLPGPLIGFFVAVGICLTTSGLGLLQVVVFHHCSHGTVFAHKPYNALAGRLISALLLFQHFDRYKSGHMLHHNNNKLLTEEDEFADFVFGLCGLEAGMPKRALWVRVLAHLVSPHFHVRFLIKRVAGAWFSHDLVHNAVGAGAWLAATAIAIATHRLGVFLVAWVLPVTVLLQIATVFRILCEHRFPDPELIRLRGREFACHATAGVFPGRMPPSRSARDLPGLIAWTGWWANMLSVQMLVRVLVLVGDAPCHDFHHRRPASRRWTSYIQARQIDSETNPSGFRTDYQESWGLFAALDQNLQSLADTPAGFITLGQSEPPIRVATPAGAMPAGAMSAAAQA